MSADGGYPSAVKLSQIPRNDVPAALDYIRERIAEDGRLSPDDGHVLSMLQDDPAEFNREAAKVMGVEVARSERSGKVLTFKPA